MGARAELLSSLDGRHFDAIVVGGGINGAGVARDAALRGLSVLLLEKSDFAGGTSSRSTKIAHGGLRYLKQLEFGLVFESLRERRLLRGLLPHLVRPQSFCYPLYEGGPDAPWKVRLGLRAYDMLGGLPSSERSRALSPAATLAANPGLRAEGLVGGVRYWDDRMDDARVVLENVLSAERAGAVCLNYVGAAAIENTGGVYRVAYAPEDGVAGTVTGDAVVNCAGPWAEHVAAMAGAASPVRLAPTKGVHVVVPRLPLQDALILPVAADGRTFFVIPWGEHSLIGTTDTIHAGAPDDVPVTAGDVDYLLEAACSFLPGHGLDRASVLHSFSGLRPLVAPRKSGLPESAISRRHRIAVERPGLITLTGGKFTTYRRMAEQTVDRLFRVLGRRSPACPTRRAPFFPATGRAPTGAPAFLAGYGPRTAEVAAVCARDERLARPALEGAPYALGQLLYAVEAEKALTLEDLVCRRTRLCWWGLDVSALRGLAAALAPFLPAWRNGLEAQAQELARRLAAGAAPQAPALS